MAIKVFPERCECQGREGRDYNPVVLRIYRAFGFQGEIMKAPVSKTAHTRESKYQPCILVTETGIHVSAISFWNRNPAGTCLAGTLECSLFGVPGSPG